MTLQGSENTSPGSLKEIDLSIVLTGYEVPPLLHVFHFS